MVETAYYFFSINVVDTGLNLAVPMELKHMLYMLHFNSTTNGVLI